MELNVEDLDKVVAGTTHETGESAALQNRDLYRQNKIEELKREREKISADFSQKTIEDLKFEYDLAERAYNESVAYYGNPAAGMRWKTIMESISSEIARREQQSEKTQRNL